jgi:hypothetical protein
LTIAEARAIVEPLYDALNEPGKKDVAALLAKAAILIINPITQTKIGLRATS